MSNEIKKVLYKEKPIAHRQKIRLLPKEHEYYHCITSLGEVKFKIPISEADGFEDKMQSQLLIRWITKNGN